MSSNNDERRYKYYIPENFTNSAKLFGFLRTRNAIELVVIAGGLALLEYSLLDLSLKAKLMIMCVTVIPLAIFLAMGIDGCSLTEYLQRMIKAYVDKKYIVKREVYSSVHAQAQFARSTFKERKKKPEKKSKSNKRAKHK